jgi:hypothetical protein
MSDQSLKTYTLNFINDSRNAWSFCVYLAPPQVNVPEVQSLAWLTAAAAATTRVALRWTLDYGFAWLQNGTLSQGKVQVVSSQIWPADLETANQVTYTTRRGLATFASQTDGVNPGSLYIRQDRRVQADKSSVGIAIAGSPAYTVSAQPNIDVIFTPTPEYWITFGKFEQGQPLDLAEITNAAPVSFAANCQAMTARLSADNLWSVDRADNG